MNEKRILGRNFVIQLSTLCVLLRKGEMILLWVKAVTEVMVGGIPMVGG